MRGTYVSSLICWSLKALLSLHKSIAFFLNSDERCFVKIHFWLFTVIGAFKAPFQSAFSWKQTTNLSVFSSFRLSGLSSIVLLTDVVKNVCFIDCNLVLAGTAAWTTGFCSSKLACVKFKTRLSLRIWVFFTLRHGLLKIQYGSQK